MIITKTTKLRKSLIALYLDGEEAFKVDKETFILSPFKEGGEITDEQLFDLIKTSDYKRAKERAMYLLGLKNYSKRQLIQKLSEITNRELATEVADKMESLGFLNDRNYAQMLTRDLVNIKKFGIQRIKSELFRKGIEKEIIDEVLCDLEVPNDENIRSILERKYPIWQEDEAVKRRAFAFLQRRGYSYSQIKNAMKIDYD